MKPKTAFIVHSQQSDSMESVRIITENTLLADIKDVFTTLYPNKIIRNKLFNRLAEEAMRVLNGTSTDEEKYSVDLKECATILDRYTDTGLIEFGQMLNKSQAFDRMMEEKRKAEEQMK